MDIQQIKSAFPTAEDTLEFFEQFADELGVVFFAEGTHIALREENTASTHLKPFLRYVDFGDDGVEMDVVDLLQAKDKSFKEAAAALKEMAKTFGLKESDAPRPTQQKKDIAEMPALTEEWVKGMKDKYFAQPKKGWAILSTLLRAATSEEKIAFSKKVDIGLFNKQYDGEWQSRVVLVERDFDGTPHCFYSYNRELATKGLLRFSKKDENGVIIELPKRVLFASNHLNTQKTIFLSEGHSDAAHAIAKGMNATTTGSATKNFSLEILNNLAGSTIHYFTDADLAGLRGAVKKGQAIESFNRANPDKAITYKVFVWGSWIEEGETITKEISLQKDFLDSVSRSKELLDLLDGVGHPSNFAWLTKTVREKGFDYTDLLLSSDENDKSLADRLKSFYV